MATYCFCGCGEKLGLSLPKRRFNKLGAKAQQTVGTLNTVSLPAVRGNPQQERRVRDLIDTGETIRDMYAGLIHGRTRAPPVKFQHYVWEWERDAGRLASEHARLAGR